MKKTYFFFDLDGTLIDNSAAIRAAYEAAGVIMPHSAIGKPRGAWCTDAQHERKNQAYPVMLVKTAVHGPAFPLWEATRNSPTVDDCYVLTGASLEGARISLEWLAIGKSRLAAHSLTLQDKIAFITEFQVKTTLAYPAGVDVYYVDSDPIVWDIAKAANCHGVHVV